GKIRKAATTPADALILDLEDSVTSAEKDMARAEVRKAIADGASFPQILLARINDYRTPYWREDVTAVVHKNLRGIKVPKVQSPEEIDELGKLLGERERAEGMTHGTVRLL